MSFHNRRQLLSYFLVSNSTHSLQKHEAIGGVEAFKKDLFSVLVKHFGSFSTLRNNSPGKL